MRGFWAGFTVARKRKPFRRHGRVTGSVYLVHLKRKVNGAQHYMGFSTDVPARLKVHRAGHGSPLLRTAAARGVSFRVVREWRRKNGEFEKELKRRYARRDLCPVCSGPRAHLKG